MTRVSAGFLNPFNLMARFMRQHTTDPRADAGRSGSGFWRFACPKSPARGSSILFTTEFTAPTEYARSVHSQLSILHFPLKKEPLQGGGEARGKCVRNLGLTSL